MANVGANANDQQDGPELDPGLIELRHVCRSILRLPEEGDLETVLRLSGYLNIQDVLATPNQELAALSAGTTRNAARYDAAWHDGIACDASTLSN